MSEISKIIDEIINIELKAFMKAHGFKKKARNFYKQLDGDIYLIVNIQGSIFNDKNEGQFTVNFGIFFPEIFKITGFGKVGSIPTLPDCSISKRIGLLMPENKDLWWKVTPSSNTNEIASELSNCVEKYGLPWLQNNSLFSDAISELKAQNPFTAAATAIVENNKSEAADIIRGIISKGSAAKSRALSWMKKYDL